MHDPNDDDIDRAYRAAVQASEDSAAAGRRRGAVLQAVQGLGAAAAPADRPGPVPVVAAPSARSAANQSSWHLSSAWWRGAAAASVIVSSALVVVHLRDEPGVTMQPGARPNADRAAQPSPPAQPAPTLPAAEATTDRLALATPPQSSTAPAPATAPSPAAEAARSAFPGDENQAANATGRVGTADADGAILDATPGPAATRCI